MNENIQNIIKSIIPSGLPSEEEIIAMKNDPQKMKDLYIKQEEIISNINIFVVNEYKKIRGSIKIMQKDVCDQDVSEIILKNEKIESKQRMKKAENKLKLSKNKNKQRTSPQIYENPQEERNRRIQRIIELKQQKQEIHNQRIRQERDLHITPRKTKKYSIRYPK